MGGVVAAISRLASSGVGEAGGDFDVGCLRCSVKNGVGKLARSVPALEAQFQGDVAFAAVEVARPDAAVFVGKGAPAVAVEVVPAVVCACDGLA